MIKRTINGHFERMKENPVLWFFTILILSLSVVLFHSLRWFSVSHGSMIPTILPGDTLFIDTPRYGERRSPPPTLSFEYGEVMVFMVRPHYFLNNAISRVVGVPGDQIRIKEGVLHINGIPVKLERIEDYEMKDENGQVKIFHQYIETLPNGKRHKIIIRDNLHETTPEYMVYPNQYFVLSDNRDSFRDSRNPNIGIIPSSIQNRKSCSPEPPLEIISKEK